MKIYLIIVTFLSFFIGYSQVNPNYNKVKGYYRKDGTYVQSHYRTNPNNTNRDNYSTKPNTNPWTGKKGYINPDNRTNYYSSSTNNQSYYYSKPNSSTEKSKFDKPIANYYPSTGNSKTKMVAKLRTKPNPVADVIIRIPKDANVQTIKKEDGYWKVKYGSWTGYLNEMYISSINNYTQNYSQEKPIANYYSSTGNSKTKMVAKLRTKPNPVADVIIRIPKNANVQTIKKENGYWKVKYGSWTGYLNEMYIK
tara:strand:- start:151638 stop:152393 length:756 start_codon:yes stop_codon:yes gene_type:complete